MKKYSLLLSSIVVSSYAMQGFELYPVKLIQETYKSLSGKQLPFYEALMQNKLSANVENQTIHFNDSKSGALYTCSMLEAHEFLNNTEKLFEQSAVIGLMTPDKSLADKLVKCRLFFENSDLKNLDLEIVEQLETNRSEVQQAIIAEDIQRMKGALTKPVQRCNKLLLLKIYKE